MLMTTSSMGQALSELTNCGPIEVLLGERDWVLDSRGFRHSASKRARVHSELEQRVRDDLLQREERCAQYERDIAEHTKNARACGRVAQTPTVSPVHRNEMKARAKRCLQLLEQARQRLNAERIVVEKARATLSRISVVQRADTDKELFDNLNKLAAGLEVDDDKLNTLEKAGEDVVENHEKLGEVEHALHRTVQSFGHSLVADGTPMEGAEYDLNDDDQLFAALNQLEEPIVPERPRPKSTTASQYQTFAPQPAATSSSTSSGLSSTALPTAPTYKPYDQRQDTGAKARVAVSVNANGRAQERHYDTPRARGDDDDLYNAF